MNTLGLEKIMQTVISALREKGYNPKEQLQGYVQTGDINYITRHNNARVIIQSISKEEILKYLIRKN